MRFFPHIQIFSRLYNLPPRQAFWSSRRPDSLAMTLEVYIRNPSNPKRELSFLEKIISGIKISKQLYKIGFNLT